MFEFSDDRGNTLFINEFLQITELHLKSFADSHKESGNQNTKLAVKTVFRSSKNMMKIHINISEVAKSNY